MVGQEKLASPGSHGDGPPAKGDLAASCPGGRTETVPEAWSDGLRQRTNNLNRLPGGKLFSKKTFTNTSRLVVSSQVWLHTIPTRDCDILMTFPAKTDDATLMWILSRLRSRIPELIVHVRHHSHTDVYGFYFTASYENLLRGAEEIGIRKPVKSEFGGGMKEFVFDDRECYEGLEDSANFLNSQERQSIVKNILFSLQAKEGDQLGKIKFLEGQGIVPILVSKGIIKQVLPLHNNEDLEYLRKNWVKTIHKSQPLDKVCDYFGVKIAMYFSYLGHYTRAVAIPAIIGIIFWFMEKKSQFYDDLFFVAFAFLNVVWATLYLEHWKRKSAELAYQWGTLDKEDELLTEPRPLFHGTLEKSSVTGRLEPHYPAWKRNLFRYCVSLPIIGLSLCVVFATMWCIFELQDWLNSLGKKGALGFVLKFLPKILLAVSIGILDDIYKKIAYWLNDKENYRLEEAYENHLIIKIVLFQFVNSFLSLFYIAFYLQDMDRLKDQLAALLITRQVIGNIKEALVPFILEKAKLFKMGYKMTEGMSPTTLEKTMQDIRTKRLSESSGNGGSHERNGKPEEEMPAKGTEGEKRVPKKQKSEESIEDFILEDPRKENREGADGVMEVSHSGPTLTQAEVESSMKVYEDTFEDYLEMLVQFGYVTLFSSAFPLAALCALLNNIIEIRSDAFKLCFTFQRPFGQRVENIGTWQDALEVMSVIAVMVNCALIGMSGLADRLFPGWGTAERIISIVILEHLVLMVKFLVAYAIPDIPHWVAEEKARLEFMRREALKRMESKSGGASVPPTPTSPPGVAFKPQFPTEVRAQGQGQKDKSPPRVGAVEALSFNSDSNARRRVKQTEEPEDPGSRSKGQRADIPQGNNEYGIKKPMTLSRVDDLPAGKKIAGSSSGRFGTKQSNLSQTKSSTIYRETKIE